jgi:hypothetical protein
VIFSREAEKLNCTCTAEFGVKPISPRAQIAKEMREKVCLVRKGVTSRTEGGWALSRVASLLSASLLHCGIFLPASCKFSGTSLAFVAAVGLAVVVAI